MATTLIQDAEVYKLSEKLSDLIWYAYNNWNHKAQHTIGLQVIRSSDSIAANLAEGLCWMRKAIQRKILNEIEQKEIAEAINFLGPKLNLFIKNQNIIK